MGKEPNASTLNTHNSALNRVFDESVARGFMNKTHVPTLINKGRDSERRPDFTREEYASMIRKLPHWINKTQHPKSVHMRELLRDYVLIMANTGMGHGTEAQNLKWQHITQIDDNEQSYLEMSVSGKTAPRDIMCKSGTINYLKRIHERSEGIKHLEFEELLKQRYTTFFEGNSPIRILVSGRRRDKKSSGRFCIDNDFFTVIQLLHKALFNV